MTIPNARTLFKLKATEQKLAAKWIKQLTKAGYTPAQMITIFRMARQIYLRKQTRNPKHVTRK